MDWLYDCIRHGGQEAANEVRPRNWLGLDAPVAFELGPDPAKTPAVVPRSTQTRPRPFSWVRLWRVFGKAIERDQAAVFRLQPHPPVRVAGVADVCDWRPASARWRRHAPAHHCQLALVADIAHHRSRIVWKHARYRREVPT